MSVAQQRYIMVDCVGRFHNSPISLLINQSQFGLVQIHGAIYEMAHHKVDKPLPNSNSRSPLRLISLHSMSKTPKLLMINKYTGGGKKYGRQLQNNRKYQNQQKRQKETRNNWAEAKDRGRQHRSLLMSSLPSKIYSIHRCNKICCFSQINRILIAFRMFSDLFPLFFWSGKKQSMFSL